MSMIVCFMIDVHDLQDDLLILCTDLFTIAGLDKNENANAAPCKYSCIARPFLFFTPRKKKMGKSGLAMKDCHTNVII